MNDVLATAHRLQQDGRPYALVSVLRVQAPASARAGDKAVVTADGIASGWIGGGCAQPAVMNTVRQALADGQARVIRIAPSDEGAVRELGDVLEFGMACHSGGTLELFVDPVLPQARLVVVGDTPLATALARLAPHVGWRVDHVTDDAVPAGAYVVVATQGRRDLQGLRAAIAAQPQRIFFVASARKSQVLKAALVEAGAPRDAVDAIVAPAGQPIGAQTPEEIALSVLAAVVAARRGVSPAPQAAAHAEGTVAAAASDPPAGTADAPAGATSAAPAKPKIAPLPPMPVIAGSCCGGGT